MSDYTLNSDGTATFEFDDFTRVLKRPTLGQYRSAIEGLGTMRETVLEADPEAKGAVKVQLDLVIDWMDSVFKTLAGEGFPRTADDKIDEDRLPSWLLNAEVIRDLVEHWQTTPSRRGAR